MKIFTNLILFIMLLTITALLLSGCSNNPNKKYIPNCDGNDNTVGKPCGNDMNGDCNSNLLRVGEKSNVTRGVPRLKELLSISLLFFYKNKQLIHSIYSFIIFLSKTPLSVMIFIL